MKKIIAKTLINVVLLWVAAGAAFIFLPLPGQIPVLMYHFIDTPERAAKEKNVVSRKSFERQVGFLHRFGYHVISLEQYEAIRTGKQKPRGREVVLTFDDGNYSFAQQAFPILKKFEMPVSLFLISGALEEGLYGSMKKETILQLAQYPWITIGSHSRTHPLLSKLTEDQIRVELAGSKKDLETLLNRPIVYFAYPGGNLDDRVARLTEESGYHLAFTTSPKKLKTLDGSRLYGLTRVKVSHTSDWMPLFWIRVSGLTDMGKFLMERIKRRF